MLQEEDILAALKQSPSFIAFLGEDRLSTYSNSAFRLLSISEQETFLIALCKTCLNELEKLKEQREIPLEEEGGPFN